MSSYLSDSVQFLTYHKSLGVLHTNLLENHRDISWMNFYWGSIKIVPMDQTAWFSLLKHQNMKDKWIKIE